MMMIMITPRECSNFYLIVRVIQYLLRAYPAYDNSLLKSSQSAWLLTLSKYSTQLTLFQSLTRLTHFYTSHTTEVMQPASLFKLLNWNSSGDRQCTAHKQKPTNASSTFDSTLYKTLQQKPQRKFFFSAFMLVAMCFVFLNCLAQWQTWRRQYNKKKISCGRLGCDDRIRFHYMAIKLAEIIW